MADTPSGGFVFPCKHIRSKEMFHQSAPFEEDEYSSGIYWCTRTHEPIGPDSNPVGPRECAAERGCYQD